MSDPTAVTRGERREAYHWGFGRPPSHPGESRHPGKVTLAAVPPVPFTPLLLHHLPQKPGRREEKWKVLHLHQPCPVPKHPGRKGRGSPRPSGAPPGWRDAPKVARSGRGSTGQTPRRLWGGMVWGRGGGPVRRGARGSRSAPPCRRAGRQVSGAAPRCPRRAVTPPPAATGREWGAAGAGGTDPLSPGPTSDSARRRPPRPRCPGCSPSCERRGG